MELYRGDYRMLAAFAAGDRPHSYQGLMLGKLVDNSLGLSDARHRELEAEPAHEWLGTIGWRIDATRTVSPTPVVSDAFRDPVVSPIPVLMIQGDLDLSTPFRNAEELIPFFPNGHLIRIVGGTHGTVRNIASADPDFPYHLYRFMAADFGATAPEAYFQNVPHTAEMPPLAFETGGLALRDALEAAAAE